MQERTQKQEALLSLLEQKGYSQDLCQEILRYMSTDFMIDRMTTYLRQNAHPSPEEAVDEMLAILDDPKAKASKKRYRQNKDRWQNCNAAKESGTGKCRRIL